MTNDAVMRKTQVPKAQNLGTIFNFLNEFSRRIGKLGQMWQAR